MVRVRVAILLFSFFFFNLPANAQKTAKPLGKEASAKTKAHHRRPDRYLPECNRAYIGLSTGINNSVGILGLQIDLAFTSSFSVATGFGLSSWGYKTGLEGRYYFSPCNRGWAAAIGMTYNTGGKNVTIKNVETTQGEMFVHVDLNPQTAFMASAYYFFSIGSQGTNRFHLQAGYSVPLSTPSFIYESNKYVPELTDKGANSIRSLAPGGVILGLGFSFGTGTNRK